MSVENVNWKEEYYKLKNAIDELEKNHKYLMDTCRVLEENLKLKDIVIREQDAIISGQTATINRLDELTERQCTNNKLMIEQMDSQSKTLVAQNDIIEEAVIFKLSDKNKQN